MRTQFDLSLYLITDTAMCGGPDGVIATVTAAVRGGVTLVQLRDPDATDDAVISLGRRLLTALESHGVPLIINDRADLAGTIGAHGVHLGQDDQDVDSARALLGPDAIVGLSVQTMEHIATAQARLADLDYLGVGPVWATASKPDHAPPLGVDAATEMVAASRWPCVLIGGIRADRVEALRETGAAGISVISAICGQADPEQAARHLRALWTKDQP